jgi:hypothetical protein
VCIIKKSNEYPFLVTPLIENGAEISRIGGGVKIAKKKRMKSIGASVKYQYFCRIVSNKI